MRQTRLQMQVVGTANLAVEGDTVLNILDYVKNPSKAVKGQEAMDVPYRKLQQEIFDRILMPSYREVVMPDNPPNEWWARTAGATGALIYFPAGRYHWEGVPQLWPRTGIFGDGYFATMFEYGSEVINKHRPANLPEYLPASHGDPAMLVVGDCTIDGTRLKGMNHGIRDIRFIPGQGHRDNTGIVLAGNLMNQKISDCNIMQHGRGKARVGLGSLKVAGYWTPESAGDIYSNVIIYGGMGHNNYQGKVNDLVVNNLQIEKAEVNLWLSSVTFGSITNCRYFHGLVGEVYTSCYDLRVANMATHCDLAGYYNKTMHVSTVVGQKCRVGYAYKYASRNSAEERRGLRFVGSGAATQDDMRAIGSEFEHKLGVWNPGDAVPGS